MGRGGHSIYVYKDGVRTYAGWVSSKKHAETFRRSQDVMSQRRRAQEMANADDATRAMAGIRISGNRGQGNRISRADFRNQVKSMNKAQIEGLAGQLTANEFTLMNRQQQQWYTDAMANRGGSASASSAPKRRTLNQLYAQAYRQGGTPDAVNRRFQQLAKEAGYENVIMTPNGPREVVRANRR